MIHKGGKASGFKNKAAEDTYDTDGVSLFHVRKTHEICINNEQLRIENAEFCI